MSSNTTALQILNSAGIESLPNSTQIKDMNNMNLSLRTCSIRSTLKQLIIKEGFLTDPYKHLCNPHYSFSIPRVQIYHCYTRSLFISSPSTKSRGLDRRQELTIKNTISSGCNYHLSLFPSLYFGEGMPPWVRRFSCHDVVAGCCPGVWVSRSHEKGNNSVRLKRPINQSHLTTAVQ